MTTDSMLSSWSGTPGSRLLGVFAAGLALALALALTLPPPTTTATSGCSVKNTSTGRTYATLQRAVNAARPSQALLVRGTCRGRTVIGKDLTVVGRKTRGWGAPRLVASNLKYPVVTIARGARVTIRSLAILHGKGVHNRGVARLADVHVWGWSDYDERQRLGIRNTGRLWLLGESSVTGTTGVINRGRLTLSGTARIRRNIPRGYARGSVLNTGVVVMHGRSNIGHNFYCPSMGCLSGSFTNKGRLVMNDRSSLTDQHKSGAAWNLGTMIMNDHASIRRNASGGWWTALSGGRGGGVDNEGRLVMRDHSSIHHNTAVAGEEPTARGGGVFNRGTLLMRGSSSIHDNEAESAVAGPGLGGGLYSTRAGTLVGVTCAPQSLASVYANTPDDCFFAE